MCLISRSLARRAGPYFLLERREETAENMYVASAVEANGTQEFQPMCNSRLRLDCPLSRVWCGETAPGQNQSRFEGGLGGTDHHCQELALIGRAQIAKAFRVFDRCSY